MKHVRLLDVRLLNEAPIIVSVKEEDPVSFPPTVTINKPTPIPEPIIEDVDEIEVEATVTPEEREDTEKKVKQTLVSHQTIRLETGEELCTRQDENELLTRARANMLALEFNRPSLGPQVYVCMQERVNGDRIDCRPFCTIRALDMYEAILKFHRDFNRLSWISLGIDPQRAQVGFRKNVDHKRDSVLFSIYRLTKDAVID